MKCGNKMCIYWKSYECILGETSINNQGNCEECINVDFDEEYLESMRRQSLERYEEIHKLWDAKQS